MKTISNITKGMLQFAAVALVVVSVAMPQAASANTGKGALILNVVTVNYKDASGVTAYAETATSSVTVNLVVSAPTLTAPADQAVASGGTITYAYTVTATANGSDTYPITTPVGATTNATGVTATPSVASITLGASVITAAPTASTIEIPAGSDTNLLVGDIVVIGGVDYAISVISANNQASHLNTLGDGVAGVTTAEVPVTLTLIANGAGPAPAFTAALVGTVVGEQGTFTVDVTATAGPATGDGSVPVTTTVKTSGGTPPTTTDPTVSTFNGVALTIVKQVYNETATPAGTFVTNATGAPGDTLTYRITVTNTGAGNATAVVVTDPMPLYTTYTAGTAKSDTAAGAYAAATTLSDASDAPADTYDFNITTANTATLNVGTLAAGATSVLYYQVTID